MEPPSSSAFTGASSGVHGGRPTRRSKQSVAEAFLARLAERADIDLSAPGFVADVALHFERLPTRYALDVNIDSLDVLSHKRLLEEARSDPATVSFAVRPVEVLVARHSSDSLSAPAFPAEVRAAGGPPGRGGTAPGCGRGAQGPVRSARRPMKPCGGCTPRCHCCSPPPRMPKHTRRTPGRTQLRM